MKALFLKSIRDVDVGGREVLVRGDLDGGINSERFEVVKALVLNLRERGAERIKVVGHKGNIDMLLELGVDMNWDLRADPREEANDESMAEELGQGFDIYVNEAFATSHRKHCSIDALPRWMRVQGKIVCAGLRFGEELEKLENINKGTLVIGGAKAEDKAGYADEMEKKGWTVLRGGLLPRVKLRSDGLDISDEEIKRLRDEVVKADVVVVAGPMGKYEVAPLGTKEIFTAVANSLAYKVAGGGDTEAALTKFGLKDKFDWISVGGGAMLEYLARETLPGIEALLD